ncbi:hypothetical protein, partial [Enterobacter ludwigii]
QKDDLWLLRFLAATFCYIFWFPIGQGTFLHSGYWVLSEIFSFQTKAQKHNVDMLVNGMCPLLIPGF